VLLGDGVGGPDEFAVYRFTPRYQFGGMLGFSNFPSLEFSGILDWNKNAVNSPYYGAGFTTTCRAIGVPYVRPRRGEMALAFPTAVRITACSNWWMAGSPRRSWKM